jgi:hypothetical protein
MILIVMIGTGVFFHAYRTGVILPSPQSGHGQGGPDNSEQVQLAHSRLKFHPFFYSIDVLLPFLDLHQKSSWWLSEQKTEEWVYFVYEFYFLVQVLAGWLLTGLVVGAISGLIKKD